MDIKHETNTGGGTFYVEQESQRPAFMTYVMSGPGLMIIDHTEVSPVFKGQGVGKQLVAAGVEYAREHKFKVVPLCPFAKAEFDKNPAYHDLLAR